ncbi:MAG: glutathione S-transferase family protein [Candidatus Eremiobacteraeota bacterium]|nr:glutathione S-transferase family protein [Candidatus Eremiobacteraeota bacterium]
MKLHGFPISNYYNIVKLAMLEKGLEFEEIGIKPNREESFLAISPCGKIPAIQVEQGCLSESRAILTYLERLAPNPPLLPADPYTAGVADQIYCIIHFNLDAAVRPLFPAAYFGEPKDPAKIAKAREDVAFGMQALKRVVKMKPFLAGSEFSLADLAGITTLPLVGTTMELSGEPNPLNELPGFEAFVAEMKKRPTVQRMLAEQKRAMEMFMAGKI